jgi:hypothetical protein
MNADTWSQCREMLLRVLTHNTAIILLLKELFYRAYLTPLVTPNGTRFLCSAEQGS